MPRPVRTPVYHFTHIDHLASVAADGLCADSVVAGSGRLTREIGQRSIKDRRRRRAVPCGPGGTVADYVPFYFAPRSPMLYSINCGQVAQYQDGQGPLVYLVTSVERLSGLGLSVVVTDRNATLALARFSDDLADLDTLVDWDLMRATYWNNTAAEPDRRERRMAECLVHGRVPWEAFHEVRVSSPAYATRAAHILSGAVPSVPIRSHPEWYF